jgi:hypothetical protein
MGPSLAGQSSLTEPASIPRHPQTQAALHFRLKNETGNSPLMFCAHQRRRTNKREAEYMKHKQIALKVLRELKAKLYAQADEAIRATDRHKPEKIQAIQRRVDRDAARVAFAINLVSVKM